MKGYGMSTTVYKVLRVKKVQLEARKEWPIGGLKKSYKILIRQL